MEGVLWMVSPQPPSPREAWAARVAGLPALPGAAWERSHFAGLPALPGAARGKVSFKLHAWDGLWKVFCFSLIPLPCRKACCPHCLYHSENSKWDGCGPCLSAPGEQADSCYSWPIAGAVGVPDRLPLFSGENVLAIWSFHSKQSQNPV